MRVVSINNQYPQLSFNEDALLALFATLDQLDFCPIPKGELSIAFVDDATLAQIHDEFMDNPAPTDVMTFPGNPNEDFAGEICVSVDRAREVSAQLDEPFSRELSLYLVHGWLHLAGFDDRNDTDRQAMRQAEKKALDALDKNDSLPSFSL